MVLASECKIWQCLLYIVKTGTLVIKLKHGTKAVESVAWLRCLFHDSDTEPFRNIGGNIVTGTHSPNRLWNIAQMIPLKISEMYYTWFDSFPERLNGDCFPSSFKLDSAHGEFLIKLLLFTRGDAINLSLQRTSDTLCISQVPGRGFYLSIR